MALALIDRFIATISEFKKATSGQIQSSGRSTTTPSGYGEGIYGVSQYQNYQTPNVRLRKYPTSKK